MAQTSLKTLALLGSLAIGSAAVAVAQDSGPIIDKLVAKGLLTDQEGEDLRTEMLKDFGSSPAGKLNVSSSISEFKISGDMRLRQQLESQSTTTAPSVDNERSRTRLRFRLNGDIALQQGWTTGFALETASASDSGNQTFENDSADYGISLSRAFIGYTNGDFTFAGGKQRNPFYTTDLVWDGDINPQGLTEQYKFEVGKTGVFTVRAGQFNVFDNSEASTANNNDMDAWMFYQQIEYSQKLTDKSSLKLAPGFFTYNDTNIGSTTNEDGFAGSTEYLKVFVLPGEVSVKDVGGTGRSLKVYGDVAYNTDAQDRVRKVYAVTNARANKTDPLAWLAGVSYGQGEGKVSGDWKVSLDYREIGLGSIDPNTNDSDFAFSNLNQTGYKLTGSYNVTAFTTINATFMQTAEMQNLVGAGGGDPGVANLDKSQLFQLDMVLKF